MQLVVSSALKCFDPSQIVIEMCLSRFRPGPFLDALCNRESAHWAIMNQYLADTPFIVLSLFSQQAFMMPLAPSLTLSCICVVLDDSSLLFSRLIEMATVSNESQNTSCRDTVCKYIGRICRSIIAIFAGLGRPRDEHFAMTSYVLPIHF